MDLAAVVLGSLRETNAKFPPLHHLIDVTVTQYTVHGFLNKLGHVRKSWQKRFFVLDLKTHTLSYYKDISLKSKKGCVDVAHICQATVAAKVAGHAYPLLLVTWQRTFHIECPSENARAVWAAAINCLIPPASAGAEATAAAAATTATLAH